MSVVWWAGLGLAVGYGLCYLVMRAVIAEILARHRHEEPWTADEEE